MIVIERRAAERRILQSGWLTEQPAEFRQALLAEARLRRYDAGQYTHHIGDDPGGIYGVVNGSFGVLTRGHSTRIVMAHIMRRGAWFGQGPMITGKPRTLSFRAMEPALVWSVPLEAIGQIAQRFPDGRRIFATLTERNFEIAARAVADLLIRRSDRRIAAVLLRVTEQDDDCPPDAAPDKAEYMLTQSDLAEMANVSRHNVNATLRDFSQRGWILAGYGKVMVRDRAGLRSLLEHDD